MGLVYGWDGMRLDDGWDWFMDGMGWDAMGLDDGWDGMG